MILIQNKISKILGFFYWDKKDPVLFIFWNSLFIAFLCLPLGINLPTPFFIIAMVLGVVHVLRQKITMKKENRVLLLFPIYFLILCASLLYTQNINEGVELIVRSISLLFFPIIFLFVKEDAATVKRLFDFLLAGLLISFGINISIGGYQIYETVKEQLVLNNDFEETISSLLYALKLGGTYLLESDFSALVNPNYISLYILLVLSYYLKNKLTTKTQSIILFILFTYLFLLASRAAYLILFIMCLMLAINIKDKGKRYLIVMMMILGSIIFLGNARILNNSKKNSVQTVSRSTSIENTRLLTWHAAWQLMEESPFIGYGVGDAQQKLIDKYKDLNYLKNYQNRYNAHNQFLQTYLQTGIIGFGVLVAIFIYLSIRMQRSRNEFVVFLVLTISIFFESMLVRFNGIVFLSIIIPLLLKERSILGSRIIRNQ
ncbi:O-antigen ligase [Aquimarina brevivitae]|uniref:O-antigen ligase n=2 Tax=Aquimarina brevivitae TaxID=323412 RepID=A0A4Q7PFN0_9FLAO|nr:O-antigen ligase [Aquimarina brevivitae]